mmetsp:Transcript_34672/g.82852  ORF Transcript_34672/g.82852 Transcript_34672/m.82852 type:complete len:251 (+) Transcript_34672:1115-1867(+)
MGGDHVVELEDFDCDEDVAGDRLEQAGAGLEGRILRAEVAHNLVVELGGVGGELHGCESLGAGLGSNLGEEHVAPGAEDDDHPDEVVPVVLELHHIYSLVVEGDGPLEGGRLFAEHGRVRDVGLSEVVDERRAAVVEPGLVVLVNRRENPRPLADPHLGNVPLARDSALLVGELGIVSEFVLDIVAPVFVGIGEVGSRRCEGVLVVSYAVLDLCDHDLAVPEHFWLADDWRDVPGRHHDVDRHLLLADSI